MYYTRLFQKASKSLTKSVKIFFLEISLCLYNQVNVNINIIYFFFFLIFLNKYKFDKHEKVCY